MWEGICLDCITEPPLRPRGWSSPCELPAIGSQQTPEILGVFLPLPKSFLLKPGTLGSIWKTGNFQGITSGHAVRLHQIIGWDCSRNYFIHTLPRVCRENHSITRELCYISHIFYTVKTQRNSLVECSLAPSSAVLIWAPTGYGFLCLPC